MLAMPLNSTFGERTKMSVNSEKESNQLSIQRKSRIGCQFRERAKLSINSEMVPIFLKIRHFSSSGQTFMKMLEFLKKKMALSPNSQQIWLSLNLQPNLALSLNVLLSVYYQVSIRSYKVYSALVAINCMLLTGTTQLPPGELQRTYTSPPPPHPPWDGINLTGFIKSEREGLNSVFFSHKSVFSNWEIIQLELLNLAQ